MSRVFQASRALMAAARASAKSTAASTKTAAAKPTKSLGIMKPVPVSPAMEKFIGSSEISRAGAIKKIWDYIKLHQLQNPVNKKEICCDTKLKTIFDGKDKVGMLEISKLISPHFIKSS